MRTTILLLALTTLIAACTQTKSSTKTAFQCPSTTAPASNLPLNPTPAAAQTLHPNGKATTAWIQFAGTLNTSYAVDAIDVDLFDTSPSTIATIKSSGKKVICYFSAGSSENWRPDFTDLNPEDMGQPLDGWAGEKWLDVRSQNVIDVMTARLDLAVTKGCDGVDPDNMDGYTQNSCFTITSDEQLAYNQKIANLARTRNLSVGLKNDPDQIAVLEPYFDFSVSEQCYQYNECASYAPFPIANKPVFNLEYLAKYRSNPLRANLCTYSLANDIRTVVRSIALDDSYRYSCD